MPSVSSSLKEIRANKVAAPARAGAFAPLDISVRICSTVDPPIRYRSHRRPHRRGVRGPGFWSRGKNVWLDLCAGCNLIEFHRDISDQPRNNNKKASHSLGLGMGRREEEGQILLSICFLFFVSQISNIWGVFVALIWELKWWESDLFLTRFVTQKDILCYKLTTFLGHKNCV